MFYFEVNPVKTTIISWKVLKMPFKSTCVQITRLPEQTSETP